MFEARQFSHSSYFSRYTAATDGKEKVADLILDATKGLDRGRLLDLGAGDGSLTKLLSPHFRETFTIDKNPIYASALGAIPNTSVQIGRIEDSVTPDKIDLALMSYSLSGLPMENRGSFLSRLFEAKNPQGKVLYVTYEDGCNWDIFSSYVYEFLGRPITGGVNLHKQELESLGFNSEILSKATTLIWGSSLDDLAEVLAFFFLDKLEQYLADISKFKTLLKEVSHQMPDGRSAIEVVEALVEVKPSLNLV